MIEVEAPIDATEIDIDGKIDQDRMIREPLIVEVPTVLTRIVALLKTHQRARVCRRHRQKGTVPRDR